MDGKWSVSRHEGHTLYDSVCVCVCVCLHVCVGHFNPEEGELGVD